ncbi:hypothetical protein DW220_08635 [Eubacterium sp. AM18-26]|nr:hypothetical protein DW220_08635 [Eubacterium sp. AM18-26]RHO24837.1 hypothetical protein DW212_08845 [Eubacterium sp. AM18-10LB-B]
MEDCAMKLTDLAFEVSDVHTMDLNEIDSIKI